MLVKGATAETSTISSINYFETQRHVTFRTVTEFSPPYVTLSLRQVSGFVALWFIQVLLCGVSREY